MGGINQRFVRASCTPGATCMCEHADIIIAARFVHAWGYSYALYTPPREVTLRRLGLVLLALTYMGVFLVWSNAVRAATITVTTTADGPTSSSQCSLHDAIKAANTDTKVGGCIAGHGADTIIVPAGVYTLTGFEGEQVEGFNNLLRLSWPIAIIGAGPLQTVLRGVSCTNSCPQPSRVVLIDANAFVTIRGVTLGDNYCGDRSDGGLYGGGILNAGDLTLMEVRIQAASASIGGGIYNSDTLAIRNTTIISNEAFFIFGGQYSIGTGGHLTFRVNTLIYYYSNSLINMSPPTAHRFHVSSGLSIASMYKVDRQNPTPLYEQIRLLLRTQIVKGDFAPGAQLPTESELCQRYEVSRITITKALNDLAQEGLIQRIQGKGSIVAPLPIKNPLNALLGFTETMRQNGLRSRSIILSVESFEGDFDLCRSFELPVNFHTRFTRFKRLMFVHDMPAVLLNVVLKEDFAAKLQEQPLENASFYKCYEQILGRRVIRNDTILTPIIATPEAIDVLQVKPGTPHFLFRGLSFVEGGMPIELATGIFRGDLFQFSSSIYRIREEVAYSCQDEVEVNQAM